MIAYLSVRLELIALEQEIILNVRLELTIITLEVVLPQHAYLVLQATCAHLPSLANIIRKFHVLKEAIAHLVRVLILYALQAHIAIKTI
jgi:hypothetical protein